MKRYIQSATSANDITESIRANAESILRNIELLKKGSRGLDDYNSGLLKKVKRQLIDANSALSTVANSVQ